jgi:hypothetical protein
MTVYRDQEWWVLFTQAMAIILVVTVLASLLTGCSYKLNRVEDDVVGGLPASKSEKSDRR